MTSLVGFPIPHSLTKMAQANDSNGVLTGSQGHQDQHTGTGNYAGKDRGRRQNRGMDLANSGTKHASGDGTEDAEEHAEEHSSGADEPSRKRRRSRKGLDKKFECPHDGCGKSYSRAEHLYRHQLNHSPKQIYSCDFPDCQRIFVRQDLCNRHRERHTARGSQLQRKESLPNHASHGNDDRRKMSSPEYISPQSSRSVTITNKSGAMQKQFPSPEHMPGQFSPSKRQSRGSFTSPSNGTQNSAFRHNRHIDQPNNSDHDVSNSQDRPHQDRSETLGAHRRQASTGIADSKLHVNMFSRSTVQSMTGSYGSLASPLSHQAFLANSTGERATSQTTIQEPYVSQQHFAPFALPPPGFSSIAATTTSREAESTFAISPPNNGITMEYQSRDLMQSQNSGADMMLLDEMSAPVTVPVFGGEGYNRSPFAMPDDFYAFLFSGQQQFDTSPVVQAGQSQQAYSNYFDTQNQYPPYLPGDTMSGGFYPQNPHRPMSVTSLLDTSPPETVISEEKSQELIDLIKERFNETDHAPVAKQKESLLEGDRSDDSHMLSRKMMQTYIGSFWWHFHPQIPMLHKPTFSPDKTPNLLLIAVMAIGAACLDKTHGHRITQAGAELSNFLAWHLRWEIFSDVHFRPPAKLWVFQALLLLEFYEKMYSTRALHERAHIHHATTITLMRRGSSLIGRSALDSPPLVRDDRQGVNCSRQSSTSGANTPDEWWHHWITNEATRRAAFAAFIMDSSHATMFGHSTVMVAHEMRLPLPCDEALWSATNSAEVGRIEASLHASGIKPVSFLEGLKRTLNAQEVRTTSFGRTILMAGLLSVTWHMNQRDLQVNSLGVSQALGGRDKWRGSLTRAFDLWKHDFDRSLANNKELAPGSRLYPTDQDDNVVFESRTVLHHLAHMAMHVDIVDCQIFARAKRLLGRTIGPQDLNSAQRKMRDIWAPTAKARDATYYALRFLCTVLLPEDRMPGAHGYSTVEPRFNYSARDDALLNRPWVLYFAALIVWSYAFALEGPTTTPVPADFTFNDQVRDMRAYLGRLGSVGSPEELKLKTGFNGCSCLLLVLRNTFEKTRWELLHEAANLLSNCIQLIGGAF